MTVITSCAQQMKTTAVYTVIRKQHNNKDQQHIYVQISKLSHNRNDVYWKARC